MSRLTKKLRKIKGKNESLYSYVSDRVFDKSVDKLSEKDTDDIDKHSDIFE